MALTVRLRDHGPLLALVGKDGESSVVSSGGKFKLHGQFALSAPPNALSDWLTFDENSPLQWCEVVREGNGGWLANRMTEIGFSFAAPIQYQPGGAGDGPWMRFSVVRVLVRQQASIVTLPNARMSLLSKPMTVGDHQCAVPSSTGPKIVNIKEAVRPDVVGVLLEKDGDGLRVISDGFEDVVLLDTFAGVSFELPPDSSIAFQTARGKAAMVFDGSQAQFGMKVVLEKATGARLNDANPYSETATELRVDTVEADGNWLSATACRPKVDKDVFIVADAPPSPAGDTSFYAGVPDRARSGAATSELRFHFPIDLAAGPGDMDLVPQFEFRGPGAGPGPSAAPLDRREAYRGLRVRGLGWSKSGPARLDATVGRVALLRQADGTARFAFEAGKPLKIKGEMVNNSVVAPKLDRASNQRVLNIPAGEMAVQIAAPADQSGPSPIVLDTNAGVLRFQAPKLVGPPLGARSFKAPGASAAGRRDQGASTDLAYDRWRLGLPQGNPSFLVRLTNDGAFPDVSNQPGAHQSWQEVFETETKDPFPLLEHPGSAVSIDHPAALRQFTGPSKRTTLTNSTKWDATGKERLVYSAVVTLVSYKLIRLALNPGEAFLPDDSIKDTADKMDDPAANKWVLANGLNDQVRAYYAADGSQDEEIIRFIHENVDIKPDTTTCAYWPFAVGISVLLYKRDANGGAGKYAPELARMRGKFGPGLAFDWSSLQSLWERADGTNVPGVFGWTAADMIRMQTNDPALWPRAVWPPRSDSQGAGRNGARLDPTDKFWRGILARDLPMVLYIPPQAQSELAKIPYLKNLIDKINDHLVMDYGWKDETGPTWSAGVLFSGDDGKVSPDAWDPYLKLNVVSFGCSGAAGDVAAAKGKLEVTIPPLTDDNGNPVKLSGSFSFDLEDGAKLGPVEVSSSNEYQSNSFPGFKKFKITRFSTDLKSAQIDTEITPSDGLAAALPFLSQDVPLRSTVRFDLAGPPSADVTFLLPAEQNTNLFGKWPLVVQGLRMRLGGTTEISASCRLNLGLGTFSSVGGDIILTKDGNGFKLDFLPREIAGSINFGDFTLEGALYWAGAPAPNDPPTPPQAGGPVAGGQLATTGRERDIWGLVRVKSGNGLFGNFGASDQDTLWLRVGSRGQLSFWIAALATTRTIEFGPGSIEDGMFILAKNADKGKLLETNLANMAVDAFSKLRLGPNDNPRNWLASWDPSDKVGTLVTASGYLRLNDTIAASSKDDDDPNPANKKFLSAVAFTSSGVVRVEAVLKLLGVENVRVGIGVDVPRRFFSASIQLPVIGYPTKQNPEFEIQGGQIVFGAGFKPGDQELYLSIGWPPRTQGDPQDPLGVDWSKSVMVRWDNFFPINTFWGGFLATYREKAGEVRIGFALRAGWTKQWQLGGDLAGAAAELGVAVGGVVLFVISSGRDAARGAVLLLPKDEHYNYVLVLERRWQEALWSLPRPVEHGYAQPFKNDHAQPFKNDHAQPFEDDRQLALRSQTRVAEIIADLNRLDVIIDATVFIDVWGNASATVLGVKVASIEIAGRVRMHMCLSVTDIQIIRAEAFMGFVFKVKIGCFEVDAHGEVTFTFIANGECPSRNAYGHLVQAPGRLLKLLP